ncbi:MAG: ABC transporter permease [Chloroflexi bacterium]|nr:ABC transporter permease [Chloroflexota bacterium]
MGKYVARRLLLFVPTLLGVILVIFTLMRVVPGDPALLILAGSEGDAGTVDKKALEALRQKLGLDKPIPVQLVEYYADVFRFDFGKSLYSNQPVLQTIIKRFPLDLEIAILAVGLTALIGIPAGVISARFQDRWPDYVLRLISITGLATPSFWIAILIIMALVAFLRWTPTIQYYQLWQDPGLNLQQLFLPAIVTGLRQTAVVIRMARATTLEVIREDYIRTARAKGLGERVVLFRHALKNAMLPVVTILGLEFGIAFGSLVVTETVFNLPGIGLLLVQSIGRRDYPTIQAVVLFITTGILVVNLLVDLTYGWLDPRIRYA